MSETCFSIQYLRPDGWWEAGRGWDDREEAEEDARAQLPHREWRVVEIESDSPTVEAAA